MADGKATVVQCDAEISSSSSSSLGDENSKKLQTKHDCDEKTINKENIRHENCSLRNDVSHSRDTEADKKVSGELDNVEKIEQNVSSVQAKLSNETMDAFDKVGNTNSLVNRKRKIVESDEKNLSDDESEPEKEITQEIPAVEFKGFKKRILIQTKKLKTLELLLSSNNTENELYKNKSERSGSKSNVKKINSKAKVNNPEKNQSEAQLIEFFQYLGLQPTVKFKCACCGEKGFQSMGTLHCHQRMCGKSGTASNLQQTSLSIDTSPSKTFINTSKVYLCSPCGTYYENWNLFLHMREMHKRYICLFCLEMFSAVEMLAEHLSLKHNIQESNYTSSDDFHAVYKGTVYLVCCTCEQMFTERANIFEHQCKEPLRLDLHHKCALCGVNCGHTCPNNNVHTTAMITQTLGVQAPIVFQNSSVKCPTSAGESNKSVFSTSDFDDICDAASFCHVDVGDEGIGKSDETCRNEGEKLAKETEKSDIVEASSSEQKLLSECVEINDAEQRSVDVDVTVKKINNEEVLDPNDNMKKTAKERLDAETDIEKSTEKLQIETNENTKTIVDGNTLDSDDIHKDCGETLERTDNMNKPVEKEFSDAVDTTEISTEKETSDLNNNLKMAENIESVINIKKIMLKIEEKLKSQNTDNEMSLQGNKTCEDEININETDNYNLVKPLSEEHPEEHDVSQKNGHELALKELSAADEVYVDSNVLQDNADKHVTEEQLENQSENYLGLDSAHPTTLDHGSDNSASINNSTLRNCEHRTEQSVHNIDDSTTVITHKSKIEESKHEDLKEAQDTDSIYNRKEICTNLIHSPNIAVSENHEIIFYKNNTSEISDNTDVTRQPDTSETSFNDGEKSVREQNSNFQNTHAECDDDHAISDTEDNLKRKENASNEVDNELCKNEPDNLKYNTHQKKEKQVDDGIQLASEGVPTMVLILEGKLAEFSVKAVVKECVRTSCTTCVYCSHAVKIAVNGKQLALHLLAEHRYTPVKNETVEDVISKLKQSLTDLEYMYFNTDSYDSTDKSYFIPYDHTYECFQCHFSTEIYKELYDHKRKMHQKNILLCVLCKSNFCSYSELLCHMCPGIYVSEDILFRCCFCSLDKISSAFRLIVHLRKRHHTCDKCLEVAGDQQKLSSHIRWKHKLHHLCYRCGITYTNKPDITNHLFWKHGTESVLCKRCLQKKWPHVYHFCIPPTVFICEECNVSFSKAVALKVHKRLHVEDTPYTCLECGQSFVSKRLMKKHEDSHNQLLTEVNKIPCNSEVNDIKSHSKTEQINIASGDEEHTNLDNDMKGKLENKDSTEGLESKVHKKRKKEKGNKTKTVVDVHDLPPLNLSSESNDSEKENKLNAVKNNVQNTNIFESECVVSESSKEEKLPVSEPEESEQPVTIVDDVWDNFHSYKAQLEKIEAMESADKTNVAINSESLVSNNLISNTVSTNVSLSDTIILLNKIMADHDYGLQNLVPEQSDKFWSDNITKTDTEIPAPREHSSSIDNDYRTFSVESQNTGSILPESDKSEAVVPLTNNKEKQKSPKKKVKTTNSSSSSYSSSDSDSSSSSCGTNCSCSSSSSSSSSSDSSSSEGKCRASEEEVVVDLPVEPIDTPIRESDLDTDESSTDEDFYDELPQRHANQLLSEKRNQLMLLATVAPVNNGTVSPTPGSEDIPQTPPNNNNLKSGKRQKSDHSKLESEKSEPLSFQELQPSTSYPALKAVSSQNTVNNLYNTVSPLHPVSNPFISDITGSGSETESTRLSKRKCVRNKFYGYSSDKDEDKPPSKFKKMDSVPVPQLPNPGFSFQPSLQVRRPVITTKTDSIHKNSDSSGSEVENKKDRELESSSNSISKSSSGSEREVHTSTNVTEQTEKSDNLYCYCQCPYDEVSDMIACDGQACTIEWFHFECVGIMVPPKGKWYCPNCRKQRYM